MNNSPVGIAKSTLLLVFSLVSSSAFAGGQTTYFEDVPNEVELLQALGKANPKIKYRGVKTRAIVFDSDAGSTSAPAPQQSAPEPEEKSQVVDQTAGAESVAEQEVESKPPPQRKKSGGNSNRPRSEEKKKVALGLYFNTNSAELTEKAREYADSIGKMLNIKQDLTITLSGHTDAVGSDRINVPLSERRAESVKNYIVSEYKIAPERIAIVGKGATESLPNTSPTAAVNRRVEIASQ
ncbi:MAG: OmpA family protein [Magnetococcales bacterium]|nr:OmpA family protein [Magnetococcales bacterium]